MSHTVFKSPIPITGNKAMRKWNEKKEKGLALQYRKIEYF